MNDTIVIKQGESETIQVTFVNQTTEELPTDLTADMTVKFPTPIELSSPITDLSATFNFTPNQTMQKLSSYPFNIRISNAAQTFVKFLSGEILIKDPFDD